MPSTITSFGLLPDGREVQLIELFSDEITVRLTSYGGRIISVIKDGIDLVHGPKTLDGLIADTCYCGAICGRVANRIAHGKFTLDREIYQLAVNNEPNHLHGGLEGFDRKLWSIEETSGEVIILSLVSPDGEEGYPGEVSVQAIYSLIGNTLELTLEAECDDKATLLNLTNHVYWNLNGEGMIDDHTLQLNASAYTPKNDVQIPDGRILPVEGTPFDLTNEASLGERNSDAYPEIANGYDHNYVLPTDHGDTDVPMVASLIGTQTGINLIISTDAPGLQVYTGDYLPLPRGGVALEAQDFPDAINHPHFPTTILRPGHLYSQTIAWTIE